MTETVVEPGEAPSKSRRRRVIKPVPPTPQPVEPETTGGIAGLVRAVSGGPAGATAHGDAGLTLMFLVCVIAGTALCFVGATSLPFARQIGFAGPLLATFIYPIWGVAVGAAAKPSLRERLADNAYYLGFIFTQVALLVGFLPAAFGFAELGAEQILRYFGVALGASLIGLVARTVLIQMSYTVDEAADVVAGEVSAMARQISQQTSLVLEHFDGLVERLAASQSRLTAELQTSMGALVQTVAAYDASVKTDTSTFQTEIAAASGSAGKASKDLDRQRARLADSVASAVSVIEGLKASLETQVENATASIEATSQAVSRGLGSLQAVNGLGEGVERVDAQVGALATRIGGLDERVNEAGEAVSQSIANLDREFDRATRVGVERVEAVTTEANQAVVALEKTLQDFRAELDRIRG